LDVSENNKEGSNDLGSTKEESKILKRIDNVTPYEQLITKSVDINAFIKAFARKASHFDGDDDSATLSKIDRKIGVQCLRETEGETGMLYSVHKVKQGGLLYIIYEYKGGDRWGETPARNWYYVKKTLSSKDFASISDGSDIAEVQKIDPVTDVYIERKNRYTKEEDFFHSFHYLEDGILSIVYEYKNGNPVVRYSEFRDDFHPNTYGWARERIMDGRVLPIDRIGQ